MPDPPGVPGAHDQITAHVSQPGKGETEIEEPTRTERTIARRAAESRATVPDLELRAEVDMSASVALRHNADSPARVSITALLVKASALALREVPRANGAYRDGRFELYSRVNVGVAVASQESYASVTVFDADRKSLLELTGELRAIAALAIAGALTPPMLSGATFALTNAGAGDVAGASVPITPGHAAVLAAGAIRRVPVLRDGAITPGLIMALTLACDHRILYGRQAMTLVSRIKQRLEHPQCL